MSGAIKKKLFIDWIIFNAVTVPSFAIAAFVYTCKIPMVICFA
jgi:hypothetical protein